MADAADSIRDHFRRISPEDVISVYLFGSEARGGTHDESDVDVGVLFDPARSTRSSERARRRTEIASDLIAATHRNEVDVVVLNDAGPELAALVVQQGRRLYCTDEETDRRFVRDAILRWSDLRPWLRRMRTLKAESLAK